MTEGLRHDIESIYRAALERTHAGNAVRATLSRRGQQIVIGDELLELPPTGVFSIAIGKAAVEMMEAVEEVLGGAFAGGLVVTKRTPAENRVRSDVMEGSHPIPDERSLAAGEAVLRFATSIPARALVICLISGGGSALVEALHGDVTLAELQRVTEGLLRAGASIQELNAVRSRMSRIKAGGLLAALRHTTIINLIVSDVLGDDIQSIASGPTVPAVSGLDGAGILARYGISADLPAQPTPSTPNAPITVICASLRAALGAAASEADRLGYGPIILASSVTGEAREVGKLVGTMLRDARSGRATLSSRSCLLMGGETVVHVTGRGVGGRNTEAALAAALELQGASGAAAGFLATDGDDGITGAAGAVVDGSTVSAARTGEARNALSDNDSYTFLREAGAVLVTGPTGTNVNDLVIGLID